jgi:hypothetical protein
MALYRIGVDGGEAEEVRDVTETLQGQLMFFDTNHYYLDGMSSIAPDGSTVALLVRSAQDALNTPNNGVWLLDLTTDAQPELVASIQDLQAALPPFQNLPGMPSGLSWTGDSSGLAVSVFSPDTHSPMLVFYHLDKASGTWTPIVDFSGVESLEALFAVDAETGVPLRYYSPWTASLSPAGDALLMYNDLGGVGGMLVSALPPAEGLPALINTTESGTLSQMSRSSRSSNGLVIMYGYLFTITQ